MTQLLGSCAEGKESTTSRMKIITIGLAISWAKMALSVCNFICAMNCKVWKNLCGPKHCFLLCFIHAFISVHITMELSYSLSCLPS